MANLHLALISKHNSGLTSSHSFNETGGTIGRSQDCDWTLDDGERFISNKHLLVSFRDGVFLLTDTSSNGTFLNKNATAIGKGNSIEPKVNDTIILGTIELAITSIDLGSVAQTPSNDLLDLVSPSLPDTPSYQANRVDEVKSLATNPPSANNLGLFDILSQESSPLPPATTAPVEKPTPAMPVSDLPQHANKIPDDWDLDDVSVSSDTQKPIEEQNAVVQPTAPPNQEPQPALISETAPIPEAKFEPEIALNETSSSVPATQQSQSTQVDNLFFDALYNKLGLPESYKQNLDKEAFIDDIATVMMSSTQGIMALLAGRSVFKQESRLSMTMIQPRSNNPIKFSLDPSDTLEMLLVKKKPGYLSSKDAYEEALHDLQQHQMAFLTGLQASLEGVLNELSPEVLTQEAKEQGKGFMGKTNSSQKWQMFADKQAHLLGKVKENLNDILSAHFSSAYEAHIKNAKID